MENDLKRSNLGLSPKPKNDARRLLKSCFGNFIFSFVPFEIWRDLIVSIADLRTINTLAQTCWGFKELIDVVCGRNLHFPLLFRKEGQIGLAKKYLLKCAENNDSIAMFHVGYAHFYSGWGFDKSDNSDEIAVGWFRKAAELGSGRAMALYAHCIQLGFGVERDPDLGTVWEKKALATMDPFVFGFVCRHANYYARDWSAMLTSFTVLAEQEDEFCQHYLGLCFSIAPGIKNDKAKAFLWTTKAAERGHCPSMYKLGWMYRDGQGCEKNIETAYYWFKKAAVQRHQEAMLRLMQLEEEKN